MNLDPINRRTLLAASGLWAAVLHAQPAARAQPWRIGLLAAIATADSMQGPQPAAVGVVGLMQGLRELGYEHGRHFHTVARGAGGKSELYFPLAAEMARLPVDVVVAGGPMLRALKQAGARLPVVMGGSEDPEGHGLVQSLARPGGNFTGMSNLNVTLTDKRLEILRELVPQRLPLGLLWKRGDIDLSESFPAARIRALNLLPIAVESEADFEPAFERARRERCGGMLLSGVLFLAHHERLNAMALAGRMPLMYSLNQSGRTDAFVAFSADINDIWRRCAGYVDRIFKGAHPSELPVEQPTKFELVLNRRNLQAMGLALPQALLARADKVIE